MKRIFWSSLIISIVAVVSTGLKFEKGHPLQPYGAPVAVELDGIAGPIFSDSFSLLLETKSLRIAGSRVTEIENGAFCAPPEIEIFDNFLLPKFSKNFFGPCPNLKVLKIINNLNLEFDTDPFSPLTNLENLTISGQKIENLDRQLLGGLKRLRGLHVAFCGAKTVAGDAFADLVDLRELRLVHNNFRKFDGDLGVAGKLQVLDLTSNRLEEFSWRVLRGLHNLKFIGLGRNKIKKFNVEEMAPFLRGVEVLEIDFNPVACEERKRVVGELKAEIASLQVFFNVLPDNSCFEQ